MKLDPIGLKSIVNKRGGSEELARQLASGEEGLLKGNWASGGGLRSSRENGLLEGPKKLKGKCTSYVKLVFFREIGLLPGN